MFVGSWSCRGVRKASICRCLRVNINALESDDDNDTEEKTLFVDWGYEDAAKAAAAGHRDIVMGFYENAGSDIRNDEEALKAVAASRDVTLVRWLLHVQRRTITPRKGMHEAAANGHVNMLELLTEEGYLEDDSVGLLAEASENSWPDDSYVLDH
ncbi:Ankyrin repeat-containing domain [Phytophthora cactorum]|nr:Ankyrin repeat-containing domain [Phytophthora cactorum]